VYALKVQAQVGFSRLDYSLNLDNRQHIEKSNEKSIENNCQDNKI